MPPAVADVVARAMSKQPDERFTTASDFGRALADAGDISADRIAAPVIREDQTTRFAPPSATDPLPVADGNATTLAGQPPSPATGQHPAPPPPPADPAPVQTWSAPHGTGRVPAPERGPNRGPGRRRDRDRGARGRWHRADARQRRRRRRLAWTSSRPRTRRMSPPTTTPPVEPTAEPTDEPTADATDEATTEPTEEPTAEATEDPTDTGPSVQDPQGLLEASLLTDGEIPAGYTFQGRDANDEPGEGFGETFCNVVDPRKHRRVVAGGQRRELGGRGQRQGAAAGRGRVRRRGQRHRLLRRRRGGRGAPARTSRSPATHRSTGRSTAGPSSAGFGDQDNLWFAALVSNGVSFDARGVPAAGGPRGGDDGRLRPTTRPSTTEDASTVFALRDP